MKLTDAVTRGLTLPPGVQDKTFFDDDCPGFGARVRATGGRAWVVMYDAAGGTVIPGLHDHHVHLGRRAAESGGAAATGASAFTAARQDGR